jgi:hypothetical protein
MDAFLNQTDPKSLAIFAIIALWSVFWKGLALWHSSRRDQRLWFVILLIVSTLGVLEIIYLFFVLKMKPKELLTGGKFVGNREESESN